MVVRRSVRMVEMVVLVILGVVVVVSVLRRGRRKLASIITPASIIIVFVVIWVS